MSKKISGVVAFAGMCALSLVLLSCGSTSSRPTGVLYVLTQGSNGVGNNVSTFAIDLNTGNLSLVNSNTTTCTTLPSETNPLPCGAPLEILLDPSGANAFVLNQGVPCVIQGTQCVSGSANPVAPTIYPYSVKSDGSLSLPGTPVSWSPCLSPPCSATSADNTPYPDTAKSMVLDEAGQFLFVIDQGSFPPPGYPTQGPFLTCPHVPSGPTDVCPSISVFAVQPGTSNLTLALGSPFYLSKIPTGLSAITFVPSGSPDTVKELLFVTNNEDICSFNCVPPSPHNDNTVGVYSVTSAGVLNEQPNSPYAIAAVNPISVIAVNTNPVGENTGGVFVYVGSQGSGPGVINPFQLCTVPDANCTQSDVTENLMVPVTCPPKQTCSESAGLYPVAMVVDPTNNFLYVASELSNNVFGFRINTTAGTLAPLAPANQPTGAQPVSIALHPTVNNTGQFLFTSNSVSDNLTGFTLSTTTGSMSSPITVIAPSAPSGLAVH